MAAPPPKVLDTSNRYFLTRGDSFGIPLVLIKLDGSNYHSWSCDVSTTLGSKNKLHFINDTLPRPPPGFAMFGHWDRCNSIVMSWLVHSLDASIAPSAHWMDTAIEIWNTLRKRYYQGDFFRISDIQEEINALRQGSLNITAYFTQLQTLWQELDQFRPLPSCSCEIKFLAIMFLLYVLIAMVIVSFLFLKDSMNNEQYSVVRSQIMMMQSILDLDHVFSLLI
ncbi:uncharacterized protein LOC109792638 [Cajanus cajan]|uniref:Retrotransposon Copia-like N-terminal domain-containing protein n=1 Tax=Cajanus cajan TaxID=3821 RepID=A0A151QTC8_CAJCA|nr:uncharacterized protein LOC109792638 [Cajanus cajan]XP_029126012.1 uncharacterized protein LOC109792638 [Cajanus cajan]KYP33571.1 hypothetical protein KK1_045567 [Cajanus cajan]